MPNRSLPPDMTFRLPSFDSALGNHIIELHVWAVRQGLGGAAAATLFDRLCQRLVIAGVPLWRAFAGMRTLHPQRAVTPILGAAISKRFNLASLNVATNTNKTCGAVPLVICFDKPQSPTEGALHGCTCVGIWPDLRRNSIFPYSKNSRLRGPLTILPSSSASVRGATPRAESGLATRSRPTGRGDSTMMTSRCCKLCYQPLRLP